MKVERYSLAGFLKLLEDHSYSANGDYELFSNPKEETFALAKVYYETRLKEDEPEMIDIDFRLVKSIITMKSKKVHNAHFTSDGKIIAEDADGAFDLGQYARILNRNLHDEESLNLIRDLVNIGYKDGTETTNYPKDFVMPISKIALTLSRGDMEYQQEDNQFVKLKVRGKPDREKKTDLYMYASLSLDENCISTGNINAFDMAVFRAILSLYNEGNTFFWPEQIYCVLSGHVKGEKIPKVTEAMTSEITESVNKLMSSMLTINCTEQLEKSKKYSDVYRLAGADRTQNMLYLEKCRVTFKNGKTVTGWKYISIEPPLLYQYSNTIGQITAVPCKALNTGGRNSTVKIAIRDYMMQEISRMKRGTRKSTKMLYQTILECCGVGEKYTDADGKQTNAGKTILNRCRKSDGYFTEFCEAWIQQGFIKGYQFEKDGIVFNV